MRRSSLLVFVALAAPTALGVRPAIAQPVLTDPVHFRIDLYADFRSLPGNPRARSALLSDGTNGFPAGLYVTGGFDRPDTPILLVDAPSHVTVFKDGLPTNEALLFAQGGYGSGMFVSEPLDLAIKRLLPDGTLTTFATVGKGPAGPFEMTYFQGSLLVTDGSDGTIVRVNPDGSSHTFATIPIPPAGPDAFPGAQAILTLSSPAAARFGGPILASNFDDGPGLTQDSIFVVSADGKTVTTIASPVQKPTSLTEGPGGAFGNNIFVSQLGINSQNSTGQVSILAPDGTLTPFLKGIDASDVVFDTKDVLGGGMFIMDGNGSPTGDLPGRIWRVRAVPAPGAALLLAIGALCLSPILVRGRA
ncbi:MAG TPA: hypothetical protein VG406_01725 [Isosphaeraceae bacterium]|jgi:hypothetical protein|nr:hypothetical protein [Isosphaeraceae bacterium]